MLCGLVSLLLVLYALYQYYWYIQTIFDFVTALQFIFGRLQNTTTKNDNWWKLINLLFAQFVRLSLSNRQLTAVWISKLSLSELRKRPIGFAKKCLLGKHCYENSRLFKKIQQKF